jgi:hypothetical protein
MKHGVASHPTPPILPPNLQTVSVPSPFKLFQPEPQLTSPQPPVALPRTL